MIPALHVAVEELDQIIVTLDALGPDDWGLPTSLGDWDVVALARHLSAVVWQQSEAFHRARLLVGEAPSFVHVEHAASQLPAGLRTAAAHLRSALAADLPEDRIVPLPFAPLPASIAAQVIAIEYGFHRYDLGQALGADQPLRSQVAGYILDQLAGMLVMLASGPPQPGAGYRLTADSREIVIIERGGAWAIGEAGTDAACEIAGSDTAIALFCMGRISQDSPLLKVIDPGGAGRFKQLFPGP